MNAHTTIAGNVGRDPELRFSQSGMAICNFSVAVTHKRGDDESTSWVDVVCFKEHAENVAESVKKGTRVIVTGRLQVREFEKRDGTPGKAVEVVADEVGLSLRWSTGSTVKSGNGAKPDAQWTPGPTSDRTYDDTTVPF